MLFLDILHPSLRLPLGSFTRDKVRCWIDVIVKKILKILTRSTTEEFGLSLILNIFGGEQNIVCALQ